jgi:putative oxidoreductase
LQDPLLRRILRRTYQTILPLAILAPGVSDVHLRKCLRIEGVVMGLQRFVIGNRSGLASILLIRLAVGLIFATQGLLKYTSPNMGLLRFTRIGFPHAGLTAHFVGAFEISCGVFVLLGLFTRIAVIPLLIIICTAIATTKIPELSHAAQGFWFMVSDARTDFSMLCSLLFLILAGPGELSLDAQWTTRDRGTRVGGRPAV